MPAGQLPAVASELPGEIEATTTGYWFGLLTVTVVSTVAPG